MSAIVFGSINMDLVAIASRLPIAKETLLGDDFLQIPGGKGANQAVALARLGISTYIVGRVGADNFGIELIKNLQASGVQTENIVIDQTTNSGVALINVDYQGENQIVVVGGANSQINQDDVDKLTYLLPSATALLLQLEIPIASVVAAAKTAQDANVKVILDPAPAQSLPDELYRLVDIITPNEVEAGQLVGFPVDGEETSVTAAEILLQRGVKCAIIKRGSQGVFCANSEESFFIPAFCVQAIDAVAAGDAFNGGLTAALVEGLSLHQAVIWGTAAGALSVTKRGGQTSLPDRNTFDAFLQKNSINISQATETEKVLCPHCQRTATNGIKCKGICVSDNDY